MKAFAEDNINATQMMSFDFDRAENLVGKGENVALFGKGFRLFICVYLSLLPVAHLRAVARRWLVVTWDSERIQDETTESSAWFYNILSVQHHHKGP